MIKVFCFALACFAGLLSGFVIESACHAQAEEKSQKAQEKQPTMYSLGPESMEQANVPRGKITEHQLSNSKVFPGTTRRYYLYVPQQYDPDQPTALTVFQDGHVYVKRNGDFRATVVMDNLIYKRQIPVMIGLFIDPGRKQKSGGKKLSNRSFEYDTLSDDYVRFLVEDILPKVESEYNITIDPDGRAICGISSGGICAFTAAWERPNAFAKVISHVGSFTNIRHGDTYPGIIRKTEPKPIRVYLQDGINDLDNEHGNWPLSNLQMHKALLYKNYDHKFELGGGGHNGNHGGAIFPDAMRWIWRDYPGVKLLPQSMTAAPNKDPHAANWWETRHQEKLLQKQKMDHVDIVMLGDSITHFWETSGASAQRKYFKNYEVLNLGFSGDRTENVLWRLRNGEVEGISPKVVMLMIGTNNTGHREEPPAETAAGIKEIITELRARLPETKILLQAIFPRMRTAEGKKRKQNDAINDIIENFADDKHVFFIDVNDIFLDDDGNLPESIMPDALHPQSKGYEAWAKAILPELEKLMK